MRTRPLIAAVLRPLGTILVLGMMAAVCMAQAPDLYRVTASDAANYDYLGCSTSLDGNVLVAGAYGEDDNGTDAGAAYVYRFDGSNWNEEQKLTASDGAAYDYFGKTVSLSGNRIVVGAYGNDEIASNAGKAYVYLFNGSTWVEEEKLTASDANAEDYFGDAVAIDGDVLIVGAPKVDVSTTDTGAAYVFRRHPVFGWVEEKKLVASDAEYYDELGRAVEVEGGLALVGATLEDATAGYDAGSVYIYRYNGSDWPQEQKIEPGDGNWYGNFGNSIAADGNLALIGMVGDDEQGYSTGSAYVFKFDGSTWSEHAKLQPSGQAQYDYFGRSVDLSGDVAVIGAYGNDEAGTECGAMYSYVTRKGVWALDQKYASRTVAPYDYCGYSVTVDGKRAVAGATGDDTAAYEGGSACVFSVNEFVLTAVPGSPSQGDKLTFTASYGNPGDPVAMFTTDVNGTPYFHMLLWFAFAADHEFTLSATVPSGLSGLDVGFMTIKLDAFGKAALSNIPRVVFQ